MENPFESPASPRTDSSSTSSVVDLTDFVPAPHVSRWLANAIDSVVVIVVFFAFALLLGFAIGLVGELTGMSNAADQLEDMITVALLVVFVALYGVLGLVEGSSWQASPGKRLLGLRVVHASGRDIKILEGVGRQFVKVVTLNLCGLAALVCLEEPARRGVWDFLLSTRVVKKNPYAGY